MDSGTARDTDQKGPDMTATTAITTGGRHLRPLLPLANLALAGAALTVSLIAITTDSDPAASNVVAQAPAAAPAGAAAAASGSATGDCLARAVIVRC
jgi:hypothetical protein